MDVDGDGRTDLVRIWDHGDGAYAQVLLSNGTGFQQVANQPVGGWDTTIQQFAMDVNGDGKIDLVRIWDHGAGQAYAHVLLSTGTGFQTVANQPIGGWGPEVQTQTLDFNGDGKADLVRVWDHGDGAYGNVWVSNGAG